MRLMASVAAAFAALAIGSAASAAIVTYDFTGAPTGNQDSLTFGTDPVLTVTASDYNIFTGTLTNPSWEVNRNGSGLGVYSGPGDTNQIDGSDTNGDEMVLLTFDTTVRLISVGFSHIDNNDEFDFRMYDPNSIFFSSTDPNTDGQFNSPGSTPTYTFNFNWTGTQFGIGASDPNDNFRITNLTFEYEPSVVPLPASSLLLLAGLGGLAAFRRKKKA